MMKRATLIAALASQFILGIGAAAAGGTASLSGGSDIETVQVLKEKMENTKFGDVEVFADDALRQKLAQLEEVHKDVVERLKAKSEGGQQPRWEEATIQFLEEKMEKIKRFGDANVSANDALRQMLAELKEVHKDVNQKLMTKREGGEPRSNEDQEHRARTRAAPERKKEYPEKEAREELVAVGRYLRAPKVYQSKMEKSKEMRNEVEKMLKEEIEKLEAHREGREPMSKEDLHQHKKRLGVLERKMKLLKAPVKQKKTPNEHEKRMKRREEKRKAELALKEELARHD